ncbi:hypothetical protein [Saccharopolyspora taberi]|uniref:Uncharacterized protein n=1 Tax=Saccharopolyspora taberi TaxID=60895 RepID=A0ABN3VNR1_9PSEU
MTAPPINGSRPRNGGVSNRQEWPLTQLPSPEAEKNGTSSQDPQLGKPKPNPGAGTEQTRRVRKLNAQLAERHGFRAVQDDPAWIEAETPRVIRQKARAAESQRLHNLLRDPAHKALSTARWRRNITTSTGIGLALSLGVSTANVQQTVADGAAEGSGRWWFAWSVEPAIAVLLLSLFAFRAFMATRGEAVEDKWIRNTEIALLITTFTLNTWQHLHWPWNAQFDLVQLMSHGVWPVLAVLIVTCVPRIWAYFGDLDHGGQPADPDLVDRLEVVRRLISEGQIAATPSRSAIEKALRDQGVKTNTAMAQRVHRCLTGRTELL